MSDTSDAQQVRINYLERDVATLQKDAATLRVMLQEVLNSQSRIETILSERAVCPSPGLCLKVQQEVRTLQDMANKAVGMGIMAKIGYAIFGGTLVTLLVTLGKKYL